MSKTEQYDIRWPRLFLQGVVILLLGGILVLASIFNRQGMVLNANELSWLPISGLLLLALGLIECFEAKMAKNGREFQLNLQVGVLDAVIGALTFLSVAEEPVRFSMMLAAFLITRGSIRFVMVLTLKLPFPIGTGLAGVLSIILGCMLWQQWPSTEGWFLSLCVNVEIIVRGWSMMMFALWIRSNNALYRIS